MSDPTDYGAYLDRLLESDPEFKAAVECERRKADIGTQIYELQQLSGLVPAVFAHKCGITRRKLESVMSGDCTEFYTRKILKRAERIHTSIPMRTIVLFSRSIQMSPLNLESGIHPIQTWDGTKWSDEP